MNQGEIGFDRRLKREWLDLTALRIAAGTSPANLRGQLDAELSATVAESGDRGARSKTITVLFRIWGSGDSKREPLRQDALRQVQQASLQERLALHWGQSIATYPFFLDAVSTIGRLLELQGELSLSELVRRTKEKWGDRERVARCARHVLQSIRDWDVLVPTKRKGVYGPSSSIRIARPELAIWLLEALLLGGHLETGSFRLLARSPALFPFSLTVHPASMRDHPRMELTRQGLDEDVLILRPD